MIAELQLAKARELALIEVQQKSIDKLKANLMDDLNEKGILKNKELQKVIQTHQQVAA